MGRVCVRDAPTIWRLLNGVVCLYKTAGETCHALRRTFLNKLSTELCELECRPPEPHVIIEGDTTQPMLVKVIPSYADHPLVVGPRYQPSDFKCSWATFLGVNTSGVLVLGVNKGTREVYRLHQSHPLRTYRIKGRLGLMTDNLYSTGKVIEEHKFHHVRRGALERLLSSMQASHQRQMFDLCGVDLQSQAAYELASSGPIRPANTQLPLIYGIKCVDFNPPDFTIEVHCVNEYESYLMGLIHSIGLKLHSLATCFGVKCIRHSFFDLDHTLLMKHWTNQ